VLLLVNNKNIFFLIFIILILCFSMLQPAETMTLTKSPIPSSCITKGITDLKVLALTFDDGPHPWYTPRILSSLSEFNIKASFFLVGKMVTRYPDIVRSIYKNGHSICNHTYNHWNLERLSPERTLFEFRSCNEAIELECEQDVKFCRPPGGHYNDSTFEAAQKVGLQMVLWNINGQDCSSISAEKITRNVMSALKPGSIILLHDGFDSTINAIPMIAAKAREHGYIFVTLDQLLRNYPSFKE